jgi:hypothetical protein
VDYVPCMLFYFCVRLTHFHNSVAGFSVSQQGVCGGCLQRFGDLRKNTLLEFEIMCGTHFIIFIHFSQLPRRSGYGFDFCVITGAEPQPIRVGHCESGEKTLRTMA